MEGKAEVTMGKGQKEHGMLGDWREVGVAWLVGNGMI